MSRLLKIFYLSIFAVLTFAAAAEAQISVLLYHKFDEADSPSTSISSTMFREQMEYLKVNNYKVLSLAEMEACLSGKRPIPEKGVVITIDDGYISEYTKAFPILKEYGYPFSIFVFTNAVGKSNYMSWDQLREIEKTGGEIGSHSVTHPRLTNENAERVRREMVDSKAMLEKELGHAVRAFAYPFGQYDDAIRAMGREAGYTLLLTSEPDNVDGTVAFDLVPRQAIVGKNMTMQKFKDKLEQPTLPVSKRLPERGRLSSNRLQQIEIRLDNPELYLPGQINLFISEVGRLEARFDPASGILSWSGDLQLKNKTNRISVTARRKSDKLFARHSYMIVLPE